MYTSQNGCDMSAQDGVKARFLQLTQEGMMVTQEGMMSVLGSSVGSGPSVDIVK